MTARRNPDGTITIPVVCRVPGAVAPAKIIGHAETIIGPGHPEYAAWDDWLSQPGGVDAEPPGDTGPGT